MSKTRFCWLCEHGEKPWYVSIFQGKLTPTISPHAALQIAREQDAINFLTLANEGLEKYIPIEHGFDVEVQE